MIRHPNSVRTLFAIGLACAIAASPASASNRMAPGFSVKTVDGRSLRLTDLKNKPVILDFWATWCGPCRASMPHLNDMHTRYGAKGLTVIGMSVDEAGSAPVKRFANKLGIKFIIAMANDEVLDSYGPIRSIPTTVFINRKGEVVRRVVGYIDKETMDTYVMEIVQ
ncbi:MAG: TlpA disulfide reductase family protein [Candidatus Eisenbacteria bacterium]